jgi:predicted phosphodiesterase
MADNLAREYGASAILCAGDLTDRFGTLHGEVALKLELAIKGLHTRFICITGNHDISQKSIVVDEAKPSYTSSIKFLEVDSKFEVVDFKTTDVEDVVIAGIPYLDGGEPMFDKANSLMQEVIDSRMVNYPEGVLILLTHGDYKDRFNTMIPYQIDQDKIKKNYNLILNGHVHKPYQEDNFINLGGVQHIDLSDVDREAYYYLITIDKLSGKIDIEKIPTYKYFPRVVLLEEGEEVPERLKGNYIHRKSSYVPTIGEATDIEKKYSTDRTKAELVESYLLDLGKHELTPTALQFI